MIYLDNNATTPMDDEVLQRMISVAENHFGNPSSIYPIGRDSKELIHSARETVANALGAVRSEIIFTGSGTESDNLAVQGIFRANPDKKEFITSTIEHPAIIQTADYLEKKGIKVTYIPVDEYGNVDLDVLRKSISEKTGLISIMHSSNELGTILPINEIVHIAKRFNIPVHTDAVQSFGKIPVDVNDLGVDLLSISAHKIYGPKGVGAIYIKKGTKIDPLILGGHQERLLRAGTENLLGIVGMEVAVKSIIQNFDKNNKTIEELSNRLKNAIEYQIPKVKFNGPQDNRVKGTLNFSFMGLEAEAILLALATKRIYVSTGSACSEDSDEISHVLSAIGLRPEIARSSIRISIGKNNTKSDIDKVMITLPEIVKKLREITAMDF